MTGSDFSFVCKKKVKLNTGDVNKGTWYYMGIIGGKFDKDRNRVNFKTETNLRPFSRTEPNQKLSIESPFTTDWVEMKVTKTDAGETTLHVAGENKTITYKARGVILVMSMANETQMDVKINRTFTLVTNNLTTNGYYDLDAAGNGFKAEDKSYKLWKTAENPASDFYSGNQKYHATYKGGLGDSYRTKFKFMTGQVTLPDGTTVSCTDESKPGASDVQDYMYFDNAHGGKHIKLNHYYLAWVMPKTVGYNYSIMLGSAECTEGSRTTTTSTLPAELEDKGYNSLPNPNTWKPDMSSIAIGGFAKKMTDAEDGKVFRLNMSLVRPMLPIERIMPNNADTKRYNDAAKNQTLYSYFRSPYLNEITPFIKMPLSIPDKVEQNGKLVDSHHEISPWNSTYNYEYSFQMDGNYWWGGTENGLMLGNGVLIVNKAYCFQGFLQKKQKPSDYAAAYRVTKESDRIMYEALYLGPHFAASNVRLFLVANPGFLPN